MDDYYKTLGVDKSADEEVITAAYRALAKKYNPDKGLQDEDRIKKINVAFEILSNKEKKNEYDEKMGYTEKDYDFLFSSIFETKPEPFDLQEEWLSLIKEIPELEKFEKHVSKVNLKIGQVYKKTIISSQTVRLKLKEKQLLTAG